MTPVRFLFVLLVLGCQSVLANPISNIRVFQTDAVPVREDLKLPPNMVVHLLTRRGALLMVPILCFAVLVMTQTFCQWRSAMMVQFHR